MQVIVKGLYNLSKIKNLIAREILDSRGNPTIEVDVVLENNQFGRMSAPSGASTGTKEAVEIRDNDPRRYLGKGVKQAIVAVQKISNEIIGLDVNEGDEIDNLMIKIDGTENKSNLGANPILAISMAVAKAASEFNNLHLFEYVGIEKEYILPVPMVNVINGGAHADNKIDVQEFMIMPVSAESMAEAIRMSAEVFHHLKAILKEKNLSTNVGDEGGFAPEILSITLVLDIVQMAIERAGYKPGVDIYLALDVAASSFHKENLYHFSNMKLDAEAMIDFYDNLLSKYPIISIEDPLSEEDNEGWKKLTAKLGKKIQIVGDDIFVTNDRILQKGISSAIANSILIKPNQIGTLFETKKAISMAKSNNYRTIISHRSGETEDTSIAHLAVGFNLGQIKTGSMSRTDRIAKYNELIRIEEYYKGKIKYAGKEILTNC